MLEDRIRTARGEGTAHKRAQIVAVGDGSGEGNEVLAIKGVIGGGADYG